MEIFEKFLELLRERYDESISPYESYKTKSSIYEDLIEILEEIIDG